MKLTKKQKEVGKTGLSAEIKTKNWLKSHGFKIIESFNKPHANHFDIKAQKGKDKWVIEVKTGENPSVNIENFLKMLKERGYRKIGLAIVAKNDVHLLEYKKMSLAGRKAWKTRRL
jgi:Holliday junction resolvase-like predicted endonuclease